MKIAYTSIAFLAMGLSEQAFAQQTEHRLGDHPAVVVKRMEARQVYDYAMQFYPHPAWLYLDAEAPHTMMDHPAVIVARRLKEDSVPVESVAARLERIEASIR